ncbi:MAG TPA: penicillin-binding protein [Bacteroides sp.]|nr:penicillin-binding protein [Bacteroides sp.]
MSNTPRLWKRYLIILWGIFSVPFILLTLMFILLAQGKLGYIPTFEELENPKNNLASLVFSADSVLLGPFALENRSYVDFDELSAHIVNALISTEDIRFNRHSGVDARGTARMIIKSVILRQDAGGGSTITQQLAKNLYPRDTTYYSWKPRRYIKLGVSKFKEWNTSVKLERNYTKNEILVMYLNTVPFGHNTFGIKTACDVFFDTSPDSIAVEQAAVLIGLLKAPTRYSPVRNPQRSKFRRDIVMSQMLKYDFLTEMEFDSLSALPIGLNYRVQDHNVGLATYLRQYLAKVMAKDKPRRREYFLFSQYEKDSIQWEENPLFGWAHKNRKPDGSPYNIYRDGLRIYTTLDSKLQEFAEESVVEHLAENLQDAFYTEKEESPTAPFSEDLDEEQVKRLIRRSMRNSDRYRGLRNAGVSVDSIESSFNTPVKMRVFSWGGEKDTIMSPLDSLIWYKYFLRAAMMAMEPGTGHVRAYVGGPNFKYFKYDPITMGGRQAGSIFKPFLYTLAMQEGYDPCYKVPNVPQTFEDRDSTWTPRSSSRNLGKMVTLRWGLANSVNNVSAWLVKQYPPQVIIDDVIKKMGVRSRIAAVNSIIYGTSDVTLYEMVGAYNTFANKGVYIEPIFVTRIEDKNGNILSRFQAKQSEAFSEKTAYLMVDLLKGVVNGGTATYRIRNVFGIEAEMGGKTGTTQNHSDGWYMGIAPNLVAGVWVGGDDRSIHFDNMSLGQGANMALPIYGRFMAKVYADSTRGIYQEDRFEKPPNFNLLLDCVDDISEATKTFDYEIWEEDF